MRRTLRFLMPLIAGLALLAAIGYIVLTRTTASWFEKDLELRSQLAIEAARTSLERHWCTGSLSARQIDPHCRREIVSG